jgi:hypothetical protein
MTAITVTPEMVRVVFLSRTGKSLDISSGVNAAIISAFDRILAS